MYIVIEHRELNKKEQKKWYYPSSKTILGLTATSIIIIYFLSGWSVQVKKRLHSRSLLQLRRVVPPLSDVDNSRLSKRTAANEHRSTGIGEE